MQSHWFIPSPLDIIETLRASQGCAMVELVVGTQPREQIDEP
jgi:hypothetical protein